MTFSAKNCDFLISDATLRTVKGDNSQHQSNTGKGHWTKEKLTWTGLKTKTGDLY